MSTMEQNNIENQVCDAISILVDEGVNSAGYDKTISALVVECVDSLKGQYKVKYQDAYYYATSDNIEVEYSKNTQVYILVPGNDFSREKKIIGTVKDLGDTYISSWNEDNQYVVVGRNCAELLKPQELCSYKSGKYKLEELILYKDGEESNNKLKLEKDELAKYLVDSKKLRIGATFKTALADEQRQRGNYGISIKAEFNDADNTGQIISQTFNLTVDDMVGMPYDFGVPTAQYLDFDINNGKNFIKITQVALLIADFPVSEKEEGEDYPNDIFISDFVIEGIAPPDAKVFTTYYLDIKSSVGKYLTETDSKTTLEAVLSLKNKTVTSSSLEYYWFIEDASVVTTSDLYCVYGGQGWRCLNDQKTITEEVTKPNGEVEKQERKEWVPGAAIREVFRKDIPNIKSIYKCVCIYNSGKSSIAAEIELENTNPTYKFEMSSVNGTEFILDRGKTTLKFLDTTKAEKDQDNSLVYHWAKTDASGGYHYLGGDNSGNGGELPVCDRFDNSSLMKYLRQLSSNYAKYLGNQLVKTKSVYSEYSTFDKENSIEAEKSVLREGFKDFGLSDIDTAKVISDIILVLKLDGPTNEELANAIQPYLDSVSVTWIDEFTFYDVPARSILSYNIFKCTAMKTNGEVLGTARIQLNNKHVANDNGYIIVENGNQTFKYSAEGVAPTDKNNKNPLTIKPLTFKLFDETGNEVSGIKDEDISWYYPLENTLIKVEGSESDSKTTDEKWGIRHGQTFVFDIESRFKYEASNDVIKIEVKHQDRILKQDTSFSFIKDGMSGTNGTDYFCRIVPKYDLDNAYPTLVYNNALGNESPLFLNKPEYTLEDNGDWFTVELWNGSELITPEGMEVTFKMLYPAASIPDSYFSLIKIQNNKFYFDKTKETLDKLEELDVVSNSNFGKEDEEKRNQYKYGLLNILRAEVSYQGKKYFAELPIAVAIININEKVNNKTINYGIYVKPGTGYNEVVYTADGARPQYANAYPFEIQVIRFEDEGNIELSTTFNNSKYGTTLKYDWTNNLGRYRQISYNGKNNKFLTREYVKDANGNNINTGRQRVVIPSPYYNGASTDLGIKCIVTKNNGDSIGTLYFPIHFMLNKFGYSALNDWDGTSVEINEDDGYILSPQIGAGKKDNNNRFTGVLMGEMKSGHDADSDIGLLGFHQGERTIFLDAETGKAEFGKTNSGQIILDPSTKENGKPVAILKSGNYVEDTVNGKGLKINLSIPYIKYGNGKFSVNSDGILTARGANFEGHIESGSGEIGGWNITPTRIWKSYTKDGQKYYNSLNIYATEEGNDRPWDNAICIGSKDINSTEFEKDKTENANFVVSHDGILKARGANITGVITATSLTLGNITNTNADLKNKGFVIQGTAITDGGSAPTESNKTTSYFKVSTDGLLQANNAVIKGTIYAQNGYFSGELKAPTGTLGGWKLDTYRLYSYVDANGNIKDKKDKATRWVQLASYSADNAIYIATRTSTSDTTWDTKFSVSFAGAMTAKSGTIGGWEIQSEYLKSENSKGRVYLRAGYGTSNEFNFIRIDKKNGSNWDSMFTVSSEGIMTANGAVIKGDSTFAGELKGASGTFSGSLSAASGEFAGHLTASTTNFKKLKAGNGNLEVNSSSIIIGKSSFTDNRVIIDASYKDDNGSEKAKGSVYIGRSGVKGWEDITIRPYHKDGSDGIGNIGTDSTYWDSLWVNDSTVRRVCTGSVREIKENIQVYNIEQAYEEIKTLPLYTYNYINDKNKQNKLGTIIDFLPAEITSKERKNELQSFDTTNLTFWNIAATQVIQQKLEKTMEEKNELQNRLDILEQKFLEMEEKLNGFN